MNETHLSFKLLHYMSEQMLIKIFSTQERVSISGLHLKHTLLDLQNRDVKRPAAKIIDCNSVEEWRRQCYFFLIKSK